jgi:hypothetical protein
MLMSAVPPEQEWPAPEAQCAWMRNRPVVLVCHLAGQKKLRELPQASARIIPATARAPRVQFTEVMCGCTLAYLSKICLQKLMEILRKCETGLSNAGVTEITKWGGIFNRAN